MAEISRRKRVVLWSLAAATSLCVLAAVVLHLVGRAPQFYHDIDRLSPDEREAESKQFVRRSAGIWNQIANESKWSGTFSERHVNAWLAEDFEEKHLGALPRGVSDPRIAFESGRVSLAFKKQFGCVTALVSGSGRLWLPEPNVLALEIEHVRAGAIPLPSGPVVEMLATAAESAGLDLEWQQYAGHPVALLRLKGPENTSGLGIDRIEIQDGMFYAAGRSFHADPKSRKGRQPDDSSDVSANDQSPESALRR